MSEGALTASEMWKALQPWRVASGGGGTARWPWSCSRWCRLMLGDGVKMEDGVDGFARGQEGNNLG